MAGRAGGRHAGGMDAITRLRPDGLVRSPAFSHVAVVPPGATTVYLGGQNGVDERGALVSVDAAEQAARAIDNAAVALAAAGATLADVVQWTVLLVEGPALRAPYGAVSQRLSTGGEPPPVTTATCSAPGPPAAVPHA